MGRRAFFVLSVLDKHRRVSVEQNLKNMLGILVDISTVLSGFNSLVFLEYGDILLPFVPERGSTAQSPGTCSSAGYACPAQDRQSTEIMRGGYPVTVFLSREGKKKRKKKSPTPLCTNCTCK